MLSLYFVQVEYIYPMIQVMWLVCKNYFKFKILLTEHHPIYYYHKFKTHAPNLVFAPMGLIPMGGLDNK